MKSLKFFAILFSFQSFIYSQNGWVQQNSGTNKLIMSCYFVNDNTGFVVGHQGLIIKTTNGGLNWFSVYNNVNYDMYAVYFFDNNTGWVSGYRPDTSIVIKTSNGGQTWTRSIVDTIGANLWGDIYFLNQMTGYLADFVSLKKTTNGGINWFIAFNGNASGVFFINNFTGWTGGFASGLYRTTNEGQTWSQQIGQLYHHYKTYIYFLNEQTGFFTYGYMGGPYSLGYFRTTTNSGINWNPYNLPYNVASISFPNNNNGYMLARYIKNYNQYISKTTNMGLNWVLHNINTTNYLTKTFFSSVNTGWAVGDSGSIFKTTTGGVTIGIRPISTEIPDNFSLSQNYPNPFNPNTKIKFSIPNPSEGGAQAVKLVIYDLLGSEIAVLVNEELKPGTYEADFDASMLPSGTYFYRLQAGVYTETKKMVLLK